MAQTGPRDKATIEALKERMARDPLSRAFLQLAEEYRKAGRFEEAVQVCNEGLARHPGYHTARIALGRTYLDAGDLESAHQALIEVLDSMPENHLAGKLLAEVQLRLGNRAGAADTYRAILSHYPGDREVEGLLSELTAGSGAAASTPEVPPAQPAADSAPSEPTGPSTGDTTAPPSPPLEMVDGGGTSPIPPSFDRDGPASAASMEDVPETAIPELPGEPAIAEPGEERSIARPDAAGERPMFSPLPDGPAAGSRPTETDALQTNTLAELYLRQGLVEKAIEVYRAMLRVDPGNERARQRLQDLSGEEDAAEAIDMAPTGPIPPGPIPAPTEPTDPVGPAAGAEDVPPDAPQAPGIEVGDPLGSRMSPVDPAGDGPAPGVPAAPIAPAASATIDRLQRWLVTIRSGTLLAGEESRR